MTSAATGTPRFAYLALAAAVLLNGAFGALYAWSVFVPGLEIEVGVTRAEISTVFSIAVVTFTAGNLIAAALFGRLPVPLLPAAGAVLAVAGLFHAATGDYTALLIGYGGMFGLAAGISYNSALQTAQAALPGRPGLANGIAISAFALGAMVSAWLLAGRIEIAGARDTLWIMGVAVGICALTAAAAFMICDVRLHRAGWTGLKSDEKHLFGICWIGMLLGAFAGLIAIGHAAPIILYFGGTPADAVLGATLIGLGNAAGRLCAGWLGDIIGIRSVAAISHLTGTAGFMFALSMTDATGALITVVSAGFAYGLVSGAYPAGLSILMGREAHGRNFALLLTAWGIAGLAGPFVGGYFFDLTGEYQIPLEMGCIASLAGIFNAMRLPRDKPRRTAP